MYIVGIYNRKKEEGGISSLPGLFESSSSSFRSALSMNNDGEEDMTHDIHWVVDDIRG